MFALVFAPLLVGELDRLSIAIEYTHGEAALRLCI